jgi:hypothetical protein
MTGPLATQLPELPEDWPCVFRRGFLSQLPLRSGRIFLKAGNLLYCALMASGDLGHLRPGAGGWIRADLRAVVLDLKDVGYQLVALVQALKGTLGEEEEAYAELARAYLHGVDGLVQRLERELNKTDQRLRQPWKAAKKSQAASGPPKKKGPCQDRRAHNLSDQDS